MPHRHAAPDLIRATVLGVALATLLPTFAAGNSGPEAIVSSSPNVTCTGAIQHPVSVQVEALDPVRRGATVRFVVHATSRVGLGRAEARLLDRGAANLAGPARVALGRLEAHRTKDATFRVVVPNSVARTLLQFEVSGEGPNGLLTRGASFNILPDGPTEVLAPVTTSTGERLLSAPARRIVR